MRSRWTLLFLLTSACGARVVEEGAPITPIPEEAYCTTAAKTYCPRLVDCCHAVKFDAEVAACETNYAKSCEADRRARLAAGRTYDASAAAICLATKMRDTKTCGTPFRLFYAPVEEDLVGMTACSQVWRGATPLGGTCSDDSDCAGTTAGVGCRRSPDASGGVCAIRKRRGEGEECSVGLDTCVGDLICASDLGGVARRCLRRASLGESCAPLVWPSCAEGLTCDPTTKTCTPPLPLGAACTPPRFRSSEPDPTCAAPNDCHSGLHVCVAPTPTGGACEPGSSAELNCRRSDYCEPGTRKCVPRKLDGQPCTVSDECRGWRCSAGRCVPNGAVADADSCKLAH
ncbi:MAG: hypothetical protein IPJ34_35965 [Myxococcales bacterium]|nr:hypothetical protein [Myxococcales bacterium]